MKKTILIFILINVCIGFLYLIYTSNNKKRNWKINESLKFQLCYYPKDFEPKGAISKAVEFGNGDQPDITNINLKEFLSLGFPVGHRKNPENYRFYLKFFEYPQTLSHLDSVNRVLDRFALVDFNHIKLIQKFVSNRNNIFVKLGKIDKKNKKFDKNNPYTVLREMDINLQESFDKRVIFSSLYISPFAKKEFHDELDHVQHSYSGVKDFHDQLIDYYNDKFHQLEETEKEIIYFSKQNSILKVIRLPKMAMYFDKLYRNLPMPQDPKNVFLSSLLLIYSEFYKIDYKMGQDDLHSYKEIPSYGKRIDKHILEIASVVDLVTVHEKF